MINKQICSGILFLGSLAVSAVWAQDAASTFSVNCANCHGVDGSGNTVLGRALKLHDLRSPGTRKLSQEELIAIISKGAGRGKMPGFQKKLGSQTIAALAAYLRTIESHPALAPLANAPNPEPADVRDVYAAKCANCHGSSGDGNTVIGRAIKIHDLRTEVQSLSHEQIIETIAHGTDGGRMAGFQKKLGTEMVEQLAAYVRVLSGQSPAVEKQTAPSLAPPSPVAVPDAIKATKQSETVTAAGRVENHTSTDTLKEKSLTNTAGASKSRSPAGAAKNKSSSGYVDLNSAEKETLMSLPGLTASDAEQIIAGRPYKSTLQFKVRNIVTPEKYAKIAAHVVTKQPRRTTNVTPE